MFAVPCLLEPPGLSRDDGREPDGITVFAYRASMPGLHLVYAFVSTHVNESAVRGGSAAKATETVKRSRCRSLTYGYQLQSK